ncbi:hypothetical protein BX600DRAFT_546796 [Xylariales sp. PMI_506]|nr:hypothetical protein BX600DRAFT_546796 [Xylariales sp. PMI_506]
MTTNATTPTMLTDAQVRTIAVVERAGAGLSAFGILSLFLAFALFKRLRSVPNTFIVFASFANLGASTACLIGYNGITEGAHSPLCQAQAFMFELFMQSDPWWSFAMAINVYMVFFFAANPHSFLGYWWAYFVVCYGIPFIPAVWLLTIPGNGVRGGVYGDATIWCWIDQNWSTLRIYTYYLPIWVCILLSSVIYIAVGCYVFKQRNQLRNLSLTNPGKRNSDSRDSAENKLFPNAAVMGSISAEVTQTTTIQLTNTDCDSNSKRPASEHWFDGPEAHLEHSRREPGHAVSPNRFRTITHISAKPPPKRPWYAGPYKAYLGWCNKFSTMDPVKLAYLRTSFVFAVSVLVTWIPSSINRVHDLFSTHGSSYALNLASAIVLPLQGVWNAVIFFSTSWSSLREEIQLRLDQRKGLPRGHLAARAVRDERAREMELVRRLGTKTRDGNCSPSEVTGDTGGTGGTMRVLRDGSF